MSILGRPTSPGGRVPLELDLPAEPVDATVEPSAEHAAPAPAAEEVPAEFVDLGMEIPERYEIDVVRALVQDPYHLLVYWELRPESLAALGDLFPDAAIGGFRPTMRLTDVEEGFEAYVTIPLSGKYWFRTMPDRAYRVDVGARSPEFGFVPVVRSEAVRTPRGTVAPTVDLDPEYRVETPQFVRLLAATGFADDRVLSDLALSEGASVTTEPKAFGTDVPVYLKTAFSRLPVEVREAAVRVAEGGTITGDFVERLPEHVRVTLLELRRDGEDEVVTAAFMHLLPQLLRRALEGEAEPDTAMPLTLPSTFAIGSSELARRPKVDWRWMPRVADAGEGLPMPRSGGASYFG